MVERGRERAYLALCSMSKVGVKTINKLLKSFGEPEEIFKSKKLREHIYLSPGQFDEIDSWRDGRKMDDMLFLLEKKNINFVSYDNPLYPERLRYLIADHPHGLFYRGKLPPNEKKSLAVIGARRCSDFGRKKALEIAKGTAAKDVVIISGLAEGIDSWGHKGALEANGETYAVLGGGVDICYPRSNISLFMEILRRGFGIISEYPPGTIHDKWHFPMRNRIISGLSDGICVVEAREKSGTLITSDFGLEQGKQIFAVPGCPDNELSGGTNSLIRTGAAAVWKWQHILEDFGIEFPEEKADPPILNKEEQKVVDIVKNDPASIDEMLQKTGFEFDKLIDIIIRLELKNAIRQAGPGRYIKV